MITKQALDNSKNIQNWSIQRSNKWTFILYQDSAPENFIEILDALHIPYILSPWHDKDINKETGELKKMHRHGAFFFDSLKSKLQVSRLLVEKLNTPAHIEVVHSPKGLYDYFTHANDEQKTQYNINDIVSGCGFDLDKFILENNEEDFLARAIDIINQYDFVEFGSVVNYARANDPLLLKAILQKPYFFAKLLDSLRYNRQQRINELRKVEKEEADTREFHRRQHQKKKDSKEEERER
ncbi:replication protein [Streptococcus rifensis]